MTPTEVCRQETAPRAPKWGRVCTGDLGSTLGLKRMAQLVRAQDVFEVGGSWGPKPPAALSRAGYGGRDLGAFVGGAALAWTVSRLGKGVPEPRTSVR